MDTQLEQRGGGLVVLVLGGLALWAFSQRRSGVPSPGSGVPGAGGVGPILPGDGGVQLGGSLGQISVNNQATMGTHRLAKLPQSNVQVTFTWQPDTRDMATKLLKPWNYRLIVRMGHNTVFGWKRSDELGFPNMWMFTTTIPGVTALQAATYVFSAPNDPNQVWDIRVELAVATPDDRFAPTTTYTKVSEGEHPGAFWVPEAGVQLGGSLGVVSVAQRPGRLVGLGRC
mgnify:CR=1 FL=1